jgi:hypothetical protein
MNIPAAVLAAMALCNQHVVSVYTGAGIASYLNGSLMSGNCVFIGANGGVSCGSTIETDAQKKEQDDAITKATFSNAYAWEDPYQQKCKTISDYVSTLQRGLDKVAADKQAAADARAKAAEQPTLDRGITALRSIKP